MRYSDEDDSLVPTDTLFSSDTTTQSRGPRLSRTRSYNLSREEREPDGTRAVFRAHEELQRDLDNALADRHRMEQSHRRARRAEARELADASSTRKTSRASESLSDEGETHLAGSPRRKHTRGSVSRTASKRSARAGWSDADLSTHLRSSSEREARWPLDESRNRRGLVVLLSLIIAAILVLWGIFSLASCVQQAFSDNTTSETESNDISLANEESQDYAEEEEELVEEFTPSTEALDTIEDTGAIATFSLLGLDAPELDQSQLATIQEALNAIEALADVGFVLYDLESGQGISYNPDVQIYGASSFKAHYAFYVCQTLVDEGLISLSDYTSATSGDTTSSVPVSDLIESAIVVSDNTAFGLLREAYDDWGFSEWVAEIGADDVIAETNTSWYPTYSPRSSAKLWTALYEYLNSDSETAAWLGSLLSETQTSFIRSALEASDAQDLVVSDKAGWISSSDSYTYNATVDAGIIEADGHTYILSIMTSLPYGDINRTLFENLASALFDARDVLTQEEEQEEESLS